MYLFKWIIKLKSQVIKWCSLKHTKLIQRFLSPDLITTGENHREVICCVAYCAGGIESIPTLLIGICNI